MDGEHPRENAPTFKHVIPRSGGCTEGPGNLVTACLGCNGERGSIFRTEHHQALAPVRIGGDDGVARREAPDA